MKKLPYKEGDVFALPLENDGFATGLIARSPRRGRVLFGYFFPDFYPTLPNERDLPTLTRQHAIKACKFGDLHLIDGRWKVISRIERWDRKQWPMPQFIRQPLLTKLTFLVTYDEDDPSLEISAERGEFDEKMYEPDVMKGADSVEYMMTQLARPVR